MPRRPALLSQADITSKTPLRLEDAVQIAFPAGGMTVSGLRTEKRKGNLDVMVLAGKEFTTLEAIERMLCRANQKAPGSISANHSGSSETVNPTVAQAAGKATLRALRQSLPNTLQKSTNQAGGNVLPMKSR